MKVTDPVCGRRIDVDDVHARVEEGAWVYFFCSPRCRRRFLDAPDRYRRLDQPARANSERSGD